MYVLPILVGKSRCCTPVDVVPVVVPAVLARERSAALEVRVDPRVLAVRVHAGDDSELVESGLG
eukprot:2301856-Rhodomonas_salina.1